jgi:hypothetical protein
MHGPKAEVDPSSEGILYKLFKVLYVPLLMKKPVRVAVMVVFFGWLCASIAVIPDIEVGLDQELSMSEESYVLKYFKVITNIKLLHNMNMKSRYHVENICPCHRAGQEFFSTLFMCLSIFLMFQTLLVFR